MNTILIKHQVGDSPLFIIEFHSLIFQKDYVFTKTNLNKYDSLINSRKHKQNFRIILELVTRKSDIICKISPTIFHGFAQVWYHNLEPNLVFGLYDLYAKLISYFNSSILAKKSIIELSLSLNEKIKVLEHISKNLTRKC
ncbi:hypothetical protein NC653_019323 [Populus alba x Populus x berolinensis]|uniref:Uncharacterized protein n=1 Tax=Populus alba x Populus x berolinensis TaxID=444605 RepID=A0AAD6VXH4_9ROSI|nr:hypothetical protein NC653_019323 [Populus alba x Populus x berolinensis]